MYSHIKRPNILCAIYDGLPGINKSVFQEIGSVGEGSNKQWMKTLRSTYYL